MSSGILGGTFDPVHTGHLILAEQARDQLGLERVLWLPAANPWRKAGEAVTPVEQRLAMVRLATADNDAFEVNTSELERAGPTYTGETLSGLRETLGGELVFLLGLDALFDLPNWHRPAELIELAELGVADRGASRPGPEALDRLLPGLSARVRWIEMPRIDISGTELRRRAAEGRSLRYLVPPGVEAYIAEHRLYATG